MIVSRSTIRKIADKVLDALKYLTIDIRIYQISFEPVHLSLFLGLLKKGNQVIMRRLGKDMAADYLGQGIYAVFNPLTGIIREVKILIRWVAIVSIDFYLIFVYLCLKRIPSLHRGTIWLKILDKINKAIIHSPIDRIMHNPGLEPLHPSIFLVLLGLGMLAVIIKHGQDISNNSIGQGIYFILYPLAGILRKIRISLGRITIAGINICLEVTYLFIKIIK